MGCVAPVVGFQRYRILFSLIMLFAFSAETSRSVEPSDKTDPPTESEITVLELSPARIAVASFTELGEGFPATFGEIVTELMITEMINRHRFTVVERSRLDVVLEELGWQTDGHVDDATAVTAGKQLGATIIITGTVMRIGETYTLAARFLDVATGEAFLASSREVDTPNDITVEIPEIAKEFIKKLDGVSESLFNEAKGLLTRGRIETGQERLEQLMIRFPRSPVVPDALIELAHINMGDFQYYDATERLNILIDTFPTHRRSGEALYLLAECYYLTVFPPPEATLALLHDLDRIVDVFAGSDDPLEAVRTKAAVARKAQELYRTALEVDKRTSHKKAIKTRLKKLAEFVGS